MRDSSLERLEEKLSARGGEAARTARSGLFSSISRARDQWAPSVPQRRSPINTLHLVLLASFIFFVGAVVFSVIVFSSGTNTVSTRNVVIAIDGPNDVRAGDTLALQVAITNKNSVPIELADLVIEFPAGTRSPDDIAREVPRLREALGTIEPGGSVSRTIRGVVFGSAGQELSVGVSVEYRVPSSNAIFVSETAYALPVSQSPVSITVDAPQEAVSGQGTAFTIRVSSNVVDVLPDMLLVAAYPPGFAFSSSVPTPISGSSVWRLGDIEPGGTRSITVQGSFTAEDGDQRVVKFVAGPAQAVEDNAIAAPFASSEISLAITKPFISLALAIQGNTSGDHTVDRGTNVRGDIRWVNNLPVRVQNLVIELSFTGSVLNRAQVVPERGFYRSSSNSIQWSAETDPTLADVAPGASGVLSFSFSTLPPGASAIQNPELTLSATASARRSGETGVPETITSAALARVRVATDLVLAATLSRNALFADFGPLPPKADQESSYTVTWSVTNSANAIANARVSATLPSYVRFTNVLAPSGAAIRYNPVGGVVVWDVGDLAAGASSLASFQVAITPSISQAGLAPTLISDQRIYGFDRFTGVDIERVVPSLSTQSGFPALQGTVVP